MLFSCGLYNLEELEDSQLLCLTPPPVIAHRVNSDLRSVPISVPPQASLSLYHYYPSDLPPFPLCYLSGLPPSLRHYSLSDFSITQSLILGSGLQSGTSVVLDRRLRSKTHAFA